MANTSAPVQIIVRLDAKRFQAFSVFDVLIRQKRWKRPLLFALIMLLFAAVCFSQVGKREGALLLGIVLALVAVGLPLSYFGSFFASVRQQAKKMGLSASKEVYRIELDSTGVKMWPAGRQNQEPVIHTWEQVYSVWRTRNAVYLYTDAAHAYLLPADQIPGGMEACWQRLETALPAAKLRTSTSAI